MNSLMELVAQVLAPIILGGAVFGIVGKYVYDFYVLYMKADNKDKVKWDWKGFGLTCAVSLVLSLILYSVILERVDELGDSVLIFSIAAQNGFFWQAIIGELGKNYAQP